MNADNDSDLVRKACAGDARAFESVVTQHYDFMYRIAYRWSGNRVDAEDITHNDFLKIADNLHNYRFESSFRTWLCRVVINTAKDSLRQNHNNQRILEIRDDLPDGSNAESKTYTNEIFTFIQQLPPEQRMALILVFGEGMTHKEAAEIENCPEGTLSWRIHEARKNLEYMMEKGVRHE